MLPQATRKVLEGGDLELPDVAFTATGEAVSLLQDPTRREIVPAAGPSFGPLGRVDVAFPVLHGPFGEDGTIQGLFEMADIPYVGAGVLASAVGMDKHIMKTMFAANGLKNPRYLVIRDHEWEESRSSLLDQAAALGLPSFTKPANLGSSVGITKCHDLDELETGITEALGHDRKILVEEAVVGREFECAVLGNDHPEASVVGEILPSREFYDYEAKYQDESSSTVIPADIDPEVSDQVRDLAIRAFKAVEAKGLARVDFFYEGGSGGRGIVVNEINTMPGFTTISMYPKLWEASGVSYSQLIDRLITLALEVHSTRKKAPG